MIYSLHAAILRNGNVVRSDIARPETVTRYLSTAENLADYQVWYYWRRAPHRVTADGFLALYESGQLPDFRRVSRTGSIPTGDVPALTAPYNVVALDRALDQRWYHMPRTRARVRRAVMSLIEALQEGREIETYAQIKFGFWYKVYFFTPCGVLKSDTTGEHLDPKDFARSVIKSQDLRPVSLTAVMENWHAGGLWEHSRPLSAILLQTWRACEEQHV